MNEMLTSPEWHHRTKAAVQWLRQSIAATGGKGSAHSWHPLLGWTKAYPETTGYMIPTLFDYAVLHENDSLAALAMACANWLTTIQLSSGAFPGLLLGNTRPSVFNTAQILFGFTRTAKEDPGNTAVHHSLKQATNWLLSALEPDFSWKKYAYVEGYTPTYYTRAVWGVLYANEALQNPEISSKMNEALEYYATRFLNNFAVSEWGFKPEQAAFTHTIAYTLEGFLEGAVILNNKTVLDKTLASANQLLAVRAQAGGRTAGRYDEYWKGDYNFVCVTGNAQLSVLYHRLFEMTGIGEYRIASQHLLKEVIDCQKMSRNPNRNGAIPGSAPFRGSYLPFRYPNWAVKFFLDALKPYKPKC